MARIHRTSNAYRKTYKAWWNMLARCNSEKCPTFADYGARGIRVCKDWHSFDAFYQDMGPSKPGQSLERINNDGHYTPDNCRWDTAQNQTQNRRTVQKLSDNIRRLSAQLRSHGIEPQYGVLSIKEPKPRAPKFKQPEARSLFTTATGSRNRSGMKLIEWLKTTKTPVAKFAEDLNIARYTLQRYLHQGRLPPHDVMVAIHAATRGEVAPNDFYALKKFRTKK